MDRHVQTTWARDCGLIVVACKLNSYMWNRVLVYMLLQMRRILSG